MNRSSVGKVNMRQLFRRVSQLAVAAKIHLHKPFAFAVRGNPGNKTEVTVGHFLSVLRLHDAVVDSEGAAADLHLFLDRTERIDPFPNGPVELFGCCLAFLAERRKNLHILDGAVAQPPKRKTEVKAKKGFTTSVFCFKFNSCEQKNSKARIVYRNFGKKSTIKISDADRNKNIEAQRALSGKHPA